MKRFFRKALLLLVLTPSLLLSQTLREEALNKAHAINLDEFYDYLGFFAHDSMEGRNTASKGYAYCADFVASKLQEFDISPAGEDGSYFQSVPMIQASIKPGSSSISYKNKEDLILKYGGNITILPSTSQETIQISAPLVWIGNGIVIPERHVNPYEGLDVKGKIVIMQISTPKAYRADSISRANSQLDIRLQAAHDAGAKGVIFYFPIKPLEKMIFKTLHKEVAGNLFALNAENVQKQFFDFDLEFLAFAKMDILEKILSQNGKSLKQLKKDMKADQFSSFELEGDFAVNYKSKLVDKTCRNVIGMIPGSDPVLKNEYIVLSAHLDHIGISEPVKGDSINNGAWDNASGSAGVLTLAHAFSEFSKAPKRSVIFLWCTGEEKGLLGSNYFVSYPTVSKDQIKACVNLDMIGNRFDAEDFIAMGYDFTNLSEAVDFAGESIGMVRDPSNKVQDQYFTQSDHYSFIQGGIPALFLWGGFTPVGEDKKKEKVYQKWEKKHLHKPDDDMEQEFSDPAFLKALKLHLLTTYYLADEMEDIRWNEDNKYYKKYVLHENK